MSYTATQQPRPSKALAAVTVALTVIQVLVSLAVVAMGMLLGFYYDACGSSVEPCNFEVGAILFYATPAAAILVFIATIIGITLRNRRRRSTWWIPLAGIVLMTEIFVSEPVLMGWATHTL